MMIDEMSIVKTKQAHEQPHRIPLTQFPYNFDRIAHGLNEYICKFTENEKKTCNNFDELLFLNGNASNLSSTSQRFGNVRLCFCDVPYSLMRSMIVSFIHVYLGAITRNVNQYCSIVANICSTSKVHTRTHTHTFDQRLQSNNKMWKFFFFFFLYSTSTCCCWYIFLRLPSYCWLVSRHCSAHTTHNTPHHRAHRTYTINTQRLFLFSSRKECSSFVWRDTKR